jgi:hypothetical protein
MDSRNNVSITFDLSRNAADKLEELVDRGETALKDLGILSVHFNRQLPKQPSIARKSFGSSSPPAETTSSADNALPLTNMLMTAQKVVDLNSCCTGPANANFDITSSRQLMCHYFGPSNWKADSPDVNVNGLHKTNITIPKSGAVALKSTNGVLSQPNPLHSNHMSTDAIPVVQLTSSNVSPITAQLALSAGKINSLPFTSVQYAVQGKPISGTYNLTATSVSPPSSTSQLVQSASAGPSVTIQPSHVNHPNHQQIVSLQNNKLHLHSLTSHPSPASTQQITLNCQRFTSPQQLHQQLSRSSSVPISSVAQALSHKSLPRISSANHTVFAVGSPSIKAPYIRNPNVGNNIRIGLQSLPSELMSKDSRQLTLPNNTFVTVSACSTGNAISFPASVVSTLNQVSMRTTSGISSDSSSSMHSTTSSNSASSTSNVALTSPLLVNLLQSDVSCDTNNPLITVPVSSAAALTNVFTGTTATGVSMNHGMVMQPPSSGLKEPIAKKAKIKKGRKPKDKPPDYEAKPITSNGSSMSSAPFVTSATNIGRKLSPADIFQSP